MDLPEVPTLTEPKEVLTRAPTSLTTPLAESELSPQEAIVQKKEDREKMISPDSHHKVNIGLRASKNSQKASMQKMNYLQKHS